MSRRLDRRLPAMLLASTLLSAGCSSTNLQSKGHGASQEGEITAPPSSVPTDAHGKPLTGKALAKAKASAAAKASGSSNTGVGAAKSSGTGGPSASSGPVVHITPVTYAGRVGPGVTSKTIKIGIVLFKVGTIGDQFGIKASYGDGEKQAAAVVNYVNANGGIAGRLVVPSYYTVDFGRAGSVQDGQFEAEACQKWTQDDKTFAVVNTALARQALLPCLGSKDVLGVHDAMPIDQDRLQPWMKYYYSGIGGPGLTLNHQASVESHVLCQRGWFKDGVVGIEYYNDAYYKKVVDTEFKPILTQCGVKKIVLQAAPRGGETPDATYVQTFRAAGVTNVMFLGEAGTYPLTLMESAESQQWHPKYALNSDMSAGVTLESAAPKAQLANVTGVGWTPVSDVDDAHDPGVVGRNNTLCLDIEKKAGQNMSDRGARLTATVYCNGLFFLKQVLAKSKGLNADDFSTAVAGLGTSFDSPGSFNPVFFSAARHDSAASYRIFQYVGGAFRYTTPLAKMP